MSDNKMDISDTTTASQESPSDGDQLLRPNIQQSSNLNDDNLSQKSSTTTGTPCNRNTLDETSRSNRELDNRNICLTLEEDENVTNDTLTTSMHDSRSGFTLASSHPLMSPNDSDSENGHRIEHFNYPDVVPEREPLRLANPITKPKANTKNSSSSSTTTTSTLNHQTLDVISGGLENISLVSPSKSESMQGMSSDYLSSGESEPDLSQYQATVTPTFQSVALVSNSLSRPVDNAIPTTQRKITLTSELMSDDVSSVDSLSNHSFDEDIENNLVSASVSSSVLDETPNDIDKDDDIEAACNLPVDEIPPYSAGIRWRKFLWRKM